MEYKDGGDTKTDLKFILAAIIGIIILLLLAFTASKASADVLQTNDSYHNSTYPYYRLYLGNENLYTGDPTSIKIYGNSNGENLCVGFQSFASEADFNSATSPTLLGETCHVDSNGSYWTITPSAWDSIHSVNDRYIGVNISYNGAPQPASYLSGANDENAFTTGYAIEYPGAGGIPWPGSDPAFEIIGMTLVSEGNASSIILDNAWLTIAQSQNKDFSNIILDYELGDCENHYCSAYAGVDKITARFRVDIWKSGTATSSAISLYSDTAWITYNPLATGTVNISKDINLGVGTWNLRPIIEGFFDVEPIIATGTVEQITITSALPPIFIGGGIGFPIASGTATSSPFYKDCSAYEGSFFSSSTLQMIGCQLEKAMRSTAEFLITPQFMNNIWDTQVDAFKQVFPFSIFFTIKDTVSNNASTTPTNQTLAINFPNGVNYTLLSSTTMQNAIGATSTSAVFTGVTTLGWLLVAFIILKTIF